MIFRPFCRSHLLAATVLGLCVFEASAQEQALAYPAVITAKVMTESCDDVQCKTKTLVLSGKKLLQVLVGRTLSSGVDTTNFAVAYAERPSDTCRGLLLLVGTSMAPTLSLTREIGHVERCNVDEFSSFNDASVSAGKVDPEGPSTYSRLQYRGFRFSNTDDEDSTNGLPEGSFVFILRGKTLLKSTTARKTRLDPFLDTALSLSKSIGRYDFIESTTSFPPPSGSEYNAGLVSDFAVNVNFKKDLGTVSLPEID